MASGEKKESAVEQAGKMAMQMYFKSQMNPSAGGGSGGLMSMASQYMSK